MMYRPDYAQIYFFKIQTCNFHGACSTTSMCFLYTRIFYTTKHEKH